MWTGDDGRDPWCLALACVLLPPTKQAATNEFDVRICNMRARFDTEAKVHLNLDFAGFFTFQTSTVRGMEVVRAAAGLRRGAHPLGELVFR